MEKLNNADVLKESFFVNICKNVKRAEGREGCALRQVSICLPYVVQLPNKIYTYKCTHTSLLAHCYPYLQNTASFLLTARRK